jgi:hypothetical protein
MYIRKYIRPHPPGGGIVVDVRKGKNTKRGERRRGKMQKKKEEEQREWIN